MLYSLLSEVYYLNGSFASWIEKTANDAIKIDPQNDLGHLLRVLVSEPDADNREKDLKRLQQVNPWIFSGTQDSGKLFQKGILEEDLLRLNKEFHN